MANAYASFDGNTSAVDLSIAPPELFWVAEAEGHIVGFAYGYYKEMPEEILTRWRAKKVGYVTLMAVAPSYRNKSLGRALLGSSWMDSRQEGLTWYTSTALLKPPLRGSYTKKRGSNRDSTG